MAESSDKTQTGKTVVIGIDGSQNSLFAIEWYASHVHRHDDHVILVYCVEMSEVLTSSDWYHSPNPGDVDAFKTILDHEVKKVQSRLEEFGELLKRLKLNGVVKSAQAPKPGEGILRVAKEENASMIVTGTRGLGKIRRTLLGSVSDYLVHHSPVPVLVCRFKEKK
ncbi:universal stress protein YxiE-like [Mytilus trossulus]|uniref:universal stress protein YxiE-like n=1 Tax=Mytilus trossulus TaxID=6551 RepID=UPI003004DAFF